MAPPGHPTRDELFRGAALENQLRRWLSDARSASERGLSDDQALTVAEDEWVSRIVERFAVEPLELHEDMTSIEDGGSGRPATVVVPFTGDPDLFDQDPRPAASRNSAGYAVGPHGRRRDGTLRVELSTWSGGLSADHMIELRLAPIREHVGQQRLLLVRFREQLAEAAKTGLTERRRRAEAHRSFLTSSSVPVRRREDAPRSFPAPLVRRPRPELPPLAAAPASPIEPKLVDEFFEHILSVIRAAGRAMTRAPKTYAAWGEEDRRQVLLLMLNTHYVGQAYAEAFNGQGKTDLLIRVEDKNLFIGECFMWGGPASLLAKLQQLFGYTTWADAHLTLIGFVDRRDFSAAVETAREVLEAHESFLGWRDSQPDGELRAGVRWPGDDGRHVTLQVMLIHTPA